MLCHRLSMGVACSWSSAPNPRGLVGDTSMAAVTSCENTLNYV